jgi:hypothetical protein
LLKANKEEATLSLEELNVMKSTKTLWTLELIEEDSPIHTWSKYASLNEIQYGPI